jgi:hypothetical protein
MTHAVLLGIALIGPVLVLALGCALHAREVVATGQPKDASDEAAHAPGSIPHAC